MNLNLRKLSIVGGAAILAVIGTLSPGRASTPSGPSMRAAAGTDHSVLFYSGRNGNKDIYILHPGEKEPRNLTGHPAQDLCPAASPDGKRVLFLSDRNGNMDIFSMAPDGSDVRSLAASPESEEHPEFTPDGKRILFVRDFDERTEIWIMNADGSEARRLTHNEARDERPFLSPDGSKIIFMSNRDGNYDIYTMAPDGSGQTRLTNTPELEIFPVWSPDGARIAYAQKFRADGRMQGMIRVMNADGSGDRAVTAVETRDENPMWSPDGRHIICQSVRDGNFEVYQVDLDGGRPVRLTDHPAWDGWACYLPTPPRDLDRQLEAGQDVIPNAPGGRLPISGTFRTLSGELRTERDMETVLLEFMKASSVTALSVAVVQDGRVAFERVLGVVDRRSGKPADSATVFRAASLSKPVFSYLVMKLVDEGLLGIDQTLADFIDPPFSSYPEYASLKGDSRLAVLTPAVLLTHASGFPNWRRQRWTGPLPVLFDPGTDFSYSGEGYHLLQFLIEKKTGRGLNELAKEKVFKPLGMGRSAYLWEDHFDGDFAVELDAGLGPLIRRSKTFAVSAGSLLSNAADYAKFLLAALDGRGLKPETAAAWRTPRLRVGGRALHDRTKPDTSLNEDIRLSWTPGWGWFRSPAGPALFHVGAEEGCENYAVLFPEKRTGIIVFSVVGRPARITPLIVEKLINDTFSPFAWMRY